MGVDVRTRAVGGLAVGFILLQFAWIGLEVGGRDGIRAFDNVAMLLASLAAGLACFVPYRRARGRLRLAWALLGAACLSWAGGQAVWAYYEHVLVQVAPYPSWADVGYFGMLPLGALALPFFFSPLESGKMKAIALLDGLIVGFSLLMFEWAFLLRHIYAATKPSDVAGFLGIAYPVGDLVLVVMALHLVLRTPPGQRKAAYSIAGGLVALSVAHLAYASLILEGGYYTGHPIDLGWSGGFLLIAYGAFASTAGSPNIIVGSPSPTLGRALLPYVPLVLVVLAVLGPLVRGNAFDRFVFANALLLGGLVFARQAIVIRENIVLRRQLGDAKALVEGTLAERTQLVNNVAHDLSGALTPIQLQLHLLENAEPSDLTVRGKSVPILNRSAAHLRHLIADLGDLAKLEAGRFRISKRPVDLSNLIRHSVEELASYAAEKSIRLELDLAALGPASVDPERITQVLYNLLRNALKFTPRGGRVQVRSSMQDGSIEIRVVDTGPGLSQDQIPRLFRPFSQVHQAGPGADVGTGLGLFICRGIVEAHGGRIWCESEGPAKGSSFCLTLPAGA